MLSEKQFLGRTCRRFTLQWHLTQTCGFHCAHCYDRTERPVTSWAEARDVLADLHDFCRWHRVQGQVCLTGGDPLAYPHFWALYAEIHRQRFALSILGNPIAPATIERLLQLGAPRYYQISLEGLESTNDRIRGPGHFAASWEFLVQARRLGLRTHVMLTLSEANLADVLPLAQELRGLCEQFTFNRLCQVGGGQAFALPSREAYREFLAAYGAAGRENPLLGFKDNLFHLLPELREQLPLFGGCTGYGCGAAFNFVALLSDGEVHACRKFPSRLGHLREASLRQIYDTAMADAYRRGPDACQQCALRNACRGCMAVVHGAGGDPLRMRDPHCWCEVPPP